MVGRHAVAESPVGESKREANRRAQRRRILAAAEALIAREGIAALSMRRLADEASVSVMTLYNQFGSKDEILDAFADAALDEIDARLAAAGPADVDPFGRCRSVITVSIELLASRPGVFKPLVLVRLERLTDGDADPRLVGDRGARMQAEGLEAAVRHGLLRPDTDVEALASQIYHGYELAVIQWAHGRLDAAGFEARALYGLAVALAATATDEARPVVEAQLDAAAAALRATSRTTITIDREGAAAENG